MRIRVSEDDTGCAPADSRFCAIDYDRYDGAPDGHTTAGFGATAFDAIRALLDRLEEMES